MSAGEEMVADQPKAKEGTNDQAVEGTDPAAQVQEERSIYDRGDADHVVAAPGEQSQPEGGTWREDVRVDPERAREILRPRNAGNEMRPRGGRDVNWRGEDDQWSALFQDESQSPHPGRQEGAVEEPTGREDDWAGPDTDREVQRTIAREPEVGEGRRTSEEPESLTSSMLRGALAGALGALAMTFASRRAGADAAADDAALEGVGLTVGFGAMLGAVYGAVQTRWEPPALAHALALSGLSYATTASGGARKADAVIAQRTGSGTVTDRLDGRDAHLAYGVTTAAAFDLLR